MYVFSHGALSWRGSEFTSHCLSYAIGSRYSLILSSLWENSCMLYVLQPVICFVVRVRTVSMFVNQEQKNFPKCFWRHFWHILDLRRSCNHGWTKKWRGCPFLARACVPLDQGGLYAHNVACKHKSVCGGWIIFVFLMIANHSKWVRKNLLGCVWAGLVLAGVLCIFAEMYSFCECGIVFTECLVVWFLEYLPSETQDMYSIRMREKNDPVGRIIFFSLEKQALLAFALRFLIFLVFCYTFWLRVASLG